MLLTNLHGISMTCARKQNIIDTSQMKEKKKEVQVKQKDSK